MTNLVRIFGYCTILLVLPFLLVVHPIVNQKSIIHYFSKFRSSNSVRIAIGNSTFDLWSREEYKAFDKLDINWPETLNRSTQPLEQAYAPSGYIPRSNNRWGNCTMETCIDWSLPGCHREMPLLIYIYPCKEPTCVLEEFQHRIITETLQIQLTHLVTSNPDEACFFYYPDGHLPQRTNKYHDISKWRKILHRLPFWKKTGANHINFKFNDYDYHFNDIFQPPNHFQDRINNEEMSRWKRQWDASILVDSNAAYGNFRSGFDVTCPLIPVKSHPTKRRLNYALSSFHKKTDKYLLTFKGKGYHPGHIRWFACERLHNGIDVIAVCQTLEICPWRINKTIRKERARYLTEKEKKLDKACIQQEERYGKYNYVKLLTNSTFILCARGRGRHIYRVIETISVGAIPVFLVNDNHLPFSEFIDWREFSFRFYEYDIDRIVPFLRNVSHERIVRMKQRAVHIFEQYFANEKWFARYIFNIIQQRTYTARNNLYKRINITQFEGYKAFLSRRYSTNG